MKRRCLILGLLAVVLAVHYSPALAQYGDEVSGSLRKIINWLSSGLGVLVFTIGVVWTGIKMTVGDTMAMRKGLLVIGGGLVIFLAPHIVNLISSFVR